MKKLFVFLLTFIVLFSISYFAVNAQSDSGVEITTNATEHIIKMPYEKSFRFIVTMKNNSNNTVNIQIDGEAEQPEGGHILQADRRYRLGPGEENNHIIVFEPSTESEGSGIGEAMDAIFRFSWQGGSEDISVDVSVEGKEGVVDSMSNIKFDVKDSSGNLIKNFSVIATLPSGMEKYSQSCTSSSECLLEVPSGDYLLEVNENYEIDHAIDGYFLQVSAKGYKSYFEADFLPAEGDGEKSITLKPLNQVGEYTLSKTVESGFSIWWIKASSDEEYFAFSQGTHGGGGVESPDSTKVILTDFDGEVLWENTTGGECWGLDISPNGEYVAAGCHDGKVYVWDKSGDLVWTKVGDEFASGTAVRWVKFSPDSKYLLAGPVENTPEKSGLFDVASGSLLWSFYTGGFLREGRFSDDGNTVYLASANGTLYAVETETGEQEWLGSGNYYIPFILGQSESAGIIIGSGKGRAFTALDLQTGEDKWEVVVDQTVTAGEVAEDGSVVGSTVGGMGYGVDSDGSIKWAREYGGVGHNAVYYTRNGEYALFGGPNPTLFDCEGNILWQREPDKEIRMSGPNDINTGATYDTWMSEDGSLLILGGDDGDIQFYKGEVKEGTNTYSQITGPRDQDLRDAAGDIVVELVDEEEEGDESTLSSLLIILGVVVIVVCIVVVVIIVVVLKKRKKVRSNEKNAGDVDMKG